MPNPLIEMSPSHLSDDDAIYFGTDINTAGAYAKISYNAAAARFDIILPTNGLFFEGKLAMTIDAEIASDPGRHLYLQRTHTGVLGAGKGLTGIEVRSTFNGTADALTSEIRGGEFKARHTTGNTFDVATFKGVIGNVDVKNGTVTTGWAVEGSIDVAAGGTFTTAACFHGSLNNSGTVGTSYGAYLHGLSGYVLTHGVYLDYCTTGITITGNVTTGITSAASIDVTIAAPGASVEGFDSLITPSGAVDYSGTSLKAVKGYVTWTTTIGYTGNAYGGWFGVKLDSTSGMERGGLVTGLYAEAHTQRTENCQPNAVAYFQSVVSGDGIMTNMPILVLTSTGGSNADKSMYAIEFGHAPASTTVSTGSGGMYFDETIKVKVNGNDRFLPLSTVEGTYTTAKLIQSSLGTDATNSTSGALIIAGGVGIAKKLYIGGLTTCSTLIVTSTSTFSDDIDVADSKKITFRAATEHIISDAASELMVTAASVVNLAVGGTDVLRVEAAKISLLQDLFTDRWESSDTNLYLGGGVLGGGNASGALNNTVLGYQAAYSLTSGDDNIVIGYKAGYALASGYDHIIIGYEAGLAMTGGNKDVYIGHSAAKTTTGGSSNVGIGYRALYISESGASENTGLGTESLSALTTGGYNIGIGQGGGNSITTGSGNIIIGKNCGNITTHNECIVIGYAVFPSGTINNGLIQIGGTWNYPNWHLKSNNDGDWEIKAASGKQIDLMIGSTDELTVTGTQVLIPSNDLLVQAGSLTVTHATLGDDERMVRFIGTVATPAMTAGYGAFEVELSVGGAGTGACAVASTWLNVGSGKTLASGENQLIHSDGIWEDSGATITGAHIAMCRYEAILGDVDFNNLNIFQLNFTQTLSAIFDVNDAAKALGFVAGTSGAAVGSIPFFTVGATALKYIRVYDSV